MKYFLPLLFVALVACSPSGSTNTVGTPHSAPANNAVATTTSTTTAPTIEPVPARDETYRYKGENDAFITVTCVQTLDAESLTYTAKGHRLGTGTFSFGKESSNDNNDKIGIPPNGSIDLVAPVLSDMSVDDMVVLTIVSPYYENTLRFRGCEPV